MTEIEKLLKEDSESQLAKEVQAVIDSFYITTRAYELMYLVAQEKGDLIHEALADAMSQVDNIELIK